MLMFGLIGFGIEGEPFSDGEPFTDGATGGFTGTVFNGSVAVEPNGSVGAATLTTAVMAAIRGSEIFGAVTCEPVPKADVDASSLCRGDEMDMHSYAVVRFTGDAGQFQVMTFIFD